MVDVDCFFFLNVEFLKGLLCIIDFKIFLLVWAANFCITLDVAGSQL